MNDLRPQPNEHELVGCWIRVDGKVDGDETCLRIEALIKEHFEYLGKDWSRWETLYRDPVDQRLWEQTYPHGEMHGGGPPALRCISQEAAKEKYGKDILNGPLT